MKNATALTLKDLAGYKFDKSSYPIMPSLSKDPSTGRIIITYHDDKMSKKNKK